MNTEFYKLTGGKDDCVSFKRAGEILRNGGLCAFPTETVYGLGANAFNERAVQSIFRAKGRPSDNPLIVHVAELDQVRELVSEITPAAQKLMEAFMPGPITVIMKKSGRIGDCVTAGLATVAVRFPEHPAAQKLIRAAGVPIAAPSANLSGKPSPTTAEHVIEDMNGRIDCILDGGSCSAGVESTVIDASGAYPILLRPGVVTYEEIKAVVPDVVIDEHVLQSAEITDTPRCPGMKYKHYAPKAEVTVVEGQPEAVRREISALLAEQEGVKTGVLRFFDHELSADVILDAGRTNREYAKNLFRCLREFDEQGVGVVFAEFLETDGCGLAVKNRLYKSAGGRVKKV